MNITVIAKIIAEKIYRNYLAETGVVDTTDISARIAASLLDDEPFEPAFIIEDKKVRVDKITITREKLVARLEPVSD